MLEALEKLDKEKLQEKVNLGLLPSCLEERPVDVFRNLPKKYQDKLNKYNSNFLGYSVILTGKESILKDKIASVILMRYMLHYKTVRLFSYPEVPDTPYFATAIMRLNLIEPKEMKAIGKYILKSITHKRIIIVGLTNIDDLHHVLPEEVTGVLTNFDKCLEIEVDPLEPEILVL